MYIGEKCLIVVCDDIPVCIFKNLGSGRIDEKYRVADQYGWEVQIDSIDEKVNLQELRTFNDLLIAGDLKGMKNILDKRYEEITIEGKRGGN